MEDAAGGEIQHHGVGADFHPRFLRFLDKAGGVFRPGQLLLEVVEAEAVVDALVEDTAGLDVPLQHHDAGAARFPGRGRRRQPRRAAADYRPIDLFLRCPAHSFSPPLPSVR